MMMIKMVPGYGFLEILKEGVLIEIATTMMRMHQFNLILLIFISLAFRIHWTLKMKPIKLMKPSTT